MFAEIINLDCELVDAGLSASLAWLRRLVGWKDVGASASFVNRSEMAFSWSSEGSMIWTSGSRVLGS